MWGEIMEYFIDENKVVYLKDVPIFAATPILEGGFGTNCISVIDKSKYTYVYLTIDNFDDCKREDLYIRVSLIGSMKFVHNKGYKCNGDDYIIVKPNKRKMKFSVKVTPDGFGTSTVSFKPLYLLNDKEEIL